MIDGKVFFMTKASINKSLSKSYGFEEDERNNI